jgi:signal transduction histidine kinase
MKNKAILALSCLVSILFIFYVFKISDEIQRKEELIEASPHVIDVTQLIKTRSIVSTQELPFESWGASSTNDSSWKEVTLPTYEIIQDQNFREGSFGYYRILIPKSVTEKFSDLKGELEFSPQYILFAQYDVYVNGKFYKSNTPVNDAQSLMNIPVEPGIDNIVAIKGKIKTGNTGINHRGKILLGKASELYDLYTKTYMINNVFPLIFILCKGAIIFVFALIYLLLSVERFFEKSLLFSICVFGEDIMTGEFLSGLMSLNTRVYAYNFLNIAANLCLLLFLGDVLGKVINKKLLYSLVGLLTVVSYAMSVDILHTGYLINFNTYLQFWNIISALVMVIYLPQMMKREKVLASVLISVLVLTMWGTFFSTNVGLNYKMLGNLLLFFMVAYQSFALFRREQLDREAKRVQLLEQEKDVAIGRTASLLAHDVRRPLEQMKLILDRVASGQLSPDFITAAKRDVDFSITSVNNQINDIINYSKNKPVTLNEISFYRVLSGSLKQVMTINKHMNISIEYDLKAEVLISGDDSRLASALTNLVSNAVEAIRDIGKRNEGLIRVSTRFENNKFVFTIFNDGPLIPESMLLEIWRPLFTHGKESGTGLGLASVLKTMQDHQGEISARNVDQRGVEFELKLSALSIPDRANEYEFHKNARDYSYDVKIAEVTKIRPLRIFLLDDDVQVHEYFQFLVTNLPFEVDLTFVSHIETAIDVVRAKRFDLYILDYDLGSEYSGHDFYQEHLSYLKANVVLHSNRVKTQVSCQHVTKPMSLQELEGLCERAYETRLKVLLVDDSELTLMAWEMFHGRHNIQLINSPEAALRFLENGENKVDLCVLDYYYDNSSMNGESLGQKIKGLKLGLKIVLASNSKLEVAGFQSIDKNQFDVRSLI